MKVSLFIQECESHSTYIARAMDIE